MKRAPDVLEFKCSAVRRYMIDSTPWFAAEDIYEILGIEYRGIESLDNACISEGWRSVRKFCTLFPCPGEDVTERAYAQDTILINKVAVYKLIFSADTPEAEMLVDWIIKDCK